MTVARKIDGEQERYQRYLCSREWAVLKELEIGWAQTAGKIVAVAVPKWDRELWLSCAIAHRFVIADTAGKAWEWLWKNPEKTHRLGAVRDSYGGDDF